MTPSAHLRHLLARLQARAQSSAAEELVPLRMSGAGIGYVAPPIARMLAQDCPGFALVDDTLHAEGGSSIEERSAPLARASLLLRDRGLLRGWRDELLAVRGGAGPEYLAVIERAACRPLGITTTAVHLNAWADEGSLHVARRSAHKNIDPGLWDNLVGGIVPAGETVLEALAREAHEEAGFDLSVVAPVAGRKLHVRRAVPEGFQSEVIHVFDATLPPTLRLTNQDGEVATIERRPLADVVDAIERNEFTLEAALVTLEAIALRSGLPGATALYTQA